MSGPFTRANWNSIIQQVNNLATNPPSGHSALPTLAEVPAGHRWSVADITAVRNKLLAICAANSFAAPVVQWKKAIIDEINTAINNGWCGAGILAIGVEDDTFDPGFYGHLTNTTCSDPDHYQVVIRANSYLHGVGSDELWTWGWLTTADFTITLDAYPWGTIIPPPALTRDITFHARRLPPPVMSVTPLTFTNGSTGFIGIYVCWVDPTHRYQVRMRDASWPGLSLNMGDYHATGGPVNANAGIYLSGYAYSNPLTFTLDLVDTATGTFPAPTVESQDFTITAV